MTLPSTMLRLALAVLLLGASTASAQVATCTPATCGQFVPNSSVPPGCTPVTCRTVGFGCFCDSLCQMYGDCCLQVDTVCNVPALFAVTPSRISTAGGTVITLTGARLGVNAGTVTVGGSACPPSLWTSTSVTCTSPAGVGSSQPVVLTTSTGVVSNSLPLGRNPPFVSTFTPASVSTAAGQVLTLVGSDFGAVAASVVSDAGVFGPPTTATHTQLVVAAPEGDDAIPVAVRAADQTSNTVFVPRTAPAITTITPSTLPAGGGTITLTGVNFGTMGAASVTVGGLACPIVMSTAHTRLVCAAPAGSGTAAVAVSVRGRVGYGSVQYPGVSVSSVSPPALPTTGGRLTFTGTGLDTPGLSITVGGVPCTTFTASAGSLQCDLGPGSGVNLPVRVTVGPTTSGVQLVLSYLPPSIASIQPATGPTSGGTLITINGANFGVAPPSVTVGGAVCPPFSSTHTRLVCTLPAGVGTNVATRVVVTGQEAVNASFSHDAPNVTGLSPANPATSGALLTLVGTNFGAASAAVTVDGLACPVVMATHTLLVCQAPPGPGGMSTARLTSGGQFSERPFTWAPPTLSTVTPASESTRGGVAITLTGSNFGNGSRTAVTVGGRACPVLAPGHVSLTCALPEGSTPGAVQVSATVGGVSSMQLPFGYLAPSVTGVTPSRAPTAGGVTLTILGDSFGTTSAAVTIGGQGCPVLQQGHGGVVCRVGAGQGQNLPLVVTSGGLMSNVFQFSYEAPFVDSTWPPKLPTGPSTLWIRGGNFGTSPTVSLSGVSCPVLRATQTEIVCAAPAGVAGQSPLVVTVASQSSAPALVLRVATCGRELANGAACEDPRECRGTGTCVGSDCVGAAASSEGLACDDGDPCTTPGTCRSGACVAPIGLDGGETCVTGSMCTGLGACGSGRCNAVPINEDAGCTDYDGTTAGDVCRMGQCVGTPIVIDAGVPVDGGSGGGSAGGMAGGGAAGGAAAGGAAAGGAAAGGSAAGGSAGGGSAAGGSAAGGSAAGGSAAGGSAAGGPAAGGSAAGGSAAGGSAAGGSAAGGSAGGGSAAGGSAGGGSVAGGSAAGGSAAGGTATAGGSPTAGGSATAGGTTGGGSAGGGGMNGAGCTCQTTDPTALWLLALVVLRRRRGAVS